jgi:hypothetical protein
MAAFGWFRRKKVPRREQERRETRELLDPYADRASVTGPDDQFVVAPHKVLANIDLALERLDLDINAMVSIEDFASVYELMTLIDELGMGSMLLAHTVNTAFGVMLARYPEDLVRAPIPPQLDVRTIVSLTGTDREHELARRVFNRRAEAPAALDETESLPEVEGHSSPEVLTGFVLLYAMYGIKLNALKDRTGIA